MIYMIGLYITGVFDQMAIWKEEDMVLPVIILGVITSYVLTRILSSGAVTRRAANILIRTLHTDSHRARK